MTPDPRRSSTPRVSVIVPTKDRFDELALLIDALERQTFDDFEVVIVDDGSSTDVRSFIDSRRPRLDFVCLRSDGTGAVAARCAGIARSRGEILAFTDSDCEPEPRWLEAGVAAIDRGAEVVQGRTLPARSPRSLERTLSYVGGEGLFATCNMFYTRGSYDAAGGFEREGDRRWGFRPDRHSQGLGFGEDSLLGWRAAKEAALAVEPEAIVRHAVTRPSLKELFSRAWQVGAFPGLVRDIPELRRTLLRSRFFLATRTRIPLYGALAAAIVGRRGIAALAFTCWTGNIVYDVGRRNEPLSTRVRVMPVEIALEAMKALALIVGSVRSRTPVL